MKRRAFLKSAAAAPLLFGILQPIPARGAAENVLLPFLKRGWSLSIAKNFDTMMWCVSAVFRPTGVRYAWMVSTELLVDRGITAEDFLVEQLGRVNPHYVEETLWRLSHG